uniref:(northern house mosquito) hypothetical protein n=1 Tax=Culex pipiens TaxID=7175 RepID=A0A8D8ISZ0_CULPI
MFSRQLEQLLDVQLLGLRDGRNPRDACFHFLDPLAQQARVTVERLHRGGFVHGLLIIVHIVVLVPGVPRRHSTLTNLTARLPTTIQQVRVHDKVVVRLQRRPKVVLPNSGRRAALQAARAVTVATSPRSPPQLSLRVALFLKTVVRAVDAQSVLGHFRAFRGNLWGQ